MNISVPKSQDEKFKRWCQSLSHFYQLTVCQSHWTDEDQLGLNIFAVWCAVWCHTYIVGILYLSIFLLLPKFDLFSTKQKSTFFLFPTLDKFSSKHITVLTLYSALLQNPQTTKQRGRGRSNIQRSQNQFTLNLVK